LRSTQAAAGDHRRWKPPRRSSRDVLRSKKYDFSKVGRLKFNIKLGLNTRSSEDPMTLRIDFFYASSVMPSGFRRTSARSMTSTTSANRRVRAVGELLENQFRIGWYEWSGHQGEDVGPPGNDDRHAHDLINAKPVMASIRSSSAAASCRSSWTRPIRCLRSAQAPALRLAPAGSAASARIRVRDVHPTTTPHLPD